MEFARGQSHINIYVCVRAYKVASSVWWWFVAPAKNIYTIYPNVIENVVYVFLYLHYLILALLFYNNK